MQPPEASPLGLTIREVVGRTGVEAPTLRMWEQRHGFPVPQRLPSGHRRYSEGDVDLIRRVVREREAGMELKAAIEGAKRNGSGEALGDEEDSIYAGLMRRRPDLTPYVLSKRTLVRMSHAIEDECGARAQQGILFASFQREKYYRSAEARWRDLSGPADSAIVMADFAELREPEGGPAEVPIDRTDPIGREWSLICDSPAFAVALAGWERPGQDKVEDFDRAFEAVWSMEPALVRDASVVASTIAERHASHLIERVRGLTAQPLTASGADHASLVSLTNRMVAYVGRGVASPG